MVGIPVSFWDGLFSGAMLVSGRVYKISTLHISDFCASSSLSRLGLLGATVWSEGIQGNKRPSKSSYWNLRFAENKRVVVWSCVYLTSIQQKGEGTWELKEGTQLDLAVYLIEGQRT